MYKVRKTRITISKLKSFSWPPGHVGTQNIVRCVAAAASPTRCAGRLGTITQNSENKNMKTLLAMAALAAVIASPAFAQTGTRSRVQAAEHPSQYDQPVGRARGSAAFGGAGHHGLRQQPLSRCRSRSERAPRSAPRLRGPRLLIAAVTSAEHSPDKVDFRFSAENATSQRKRHAKPRVTPGVLFIATMRMPRSAVVIRGLDLIGARIRHLVSRTRCAELKGTPVFAGQRSGAPLIRDLREGDVYNDPRKS